MNENSSKRREWVKTAAIIFLSILLLLTFFSQTIMNHSLPEVATKNVMSGTITSKIRGEGTVESGDPYTIEIASQYVGRKVTSIPHKVGDKVNKGDVLLTLSDGEGTDLQNAKEALKMAEESLKIAQDAYDDAILTAGITSTDINNSKKDVSAATYRKMITDLQNELKAAKDKVTPLETAVSQLEQAIADCNKQIEFEGDKRSLAASRVNTATTVLVQAQNNQQIAKDRFDEAWFAREDLINEKAELEESYANDPDAHEDIEAERADVEARLTAANQVLSERSGALDQANTALDKANEEMDSANAELNAAEASPTSNNVSKLKSDYEISKYNYEKQVTAAKNEVDRIQSELNELISKIGDVSNLQALQDKIDAAKKDVSDKKKKVAEIEGETAGSEILSDIAGTITAINVSSGKQIETRDVIVLQPEGQGYFMTVGVTNEQAKLVSIGDKANLVNSWYYYGDINITLRSIKPDKTDPGKKKMLNFTVEGDVTAGQSLNISVGQRSQTYDYIVPKSALRNDNNGDYILIVESKSSPLGNRYIATRVDITVLAEDDTQAAISGAINGWEYVITTASAPIKAGSQVRMTDN